MSRTRLKSIYKCAKITYGCPELLFDRALERKEELTAVRAALKRRLLGMLEQKANVICIDLTSFHVQTKPLKTWQYRDAKLQVQTPIYRPRN
jgi:hypothetical protein